MKTTLEIPDALFRRAKSAAAERGIPFRELVSEALSEKLVVKVAGSKPWMKSFGGLKALRQETKHIGQIIDQEFDQVEAEDLE